MRLFCICESIPHVSAAVAAACVRNKERVDGDSVRSEAGARVETEPPEPEQRSADDDVRHVAGLQARVPPLAKQQRSSHGGYGGVDVDDRAAREIERAEAKEPAFNLVCSLQAIAEPHPVGDGRIYQRHPGD